jgi:hypothetical protein
LEKSAKSAKQKFAKKRNTKPFVENMDYYTVITSTL